MNNCRAAYPNPYIKITAHNPRACRQTSAFDLIVNRPDEDRGYQLERTEVHDRKMNDTVPPYAHRESKGRRCQGNGNA